MPDEKLELSIPEAMANIAEALDQILNGTEGGAPRNGFALLLFPFGGKDARCNCIVNGAARADVIKLLRTQADQLERDMKKEKLGRVDDEVGQGLSKTSLFLHELAQRKITREQCKHKIINECNVADFNLDQLLDIYDPDKMQ
jgi:hypothetical protein